MVTEVLPDYTPAMYEPTEREQLAMALAGAEADVAHYRELLGLPDEAKQLRVLMRELIKSARNGLVPADTLDRACEALDWKV